MWFALLMFCFGPGVVNSLLCCLELGSPNPVKQVRSVRGLSASPSLTEVEKNQKIPPYRLLESSHGPAARSHCALAILGHIDVKFGHYRQLYPVENRQKLELQKKTTFSCYFYPLDYCIFQDSHPSRN